MFSCPGPARFRETAGVAGWLAFPALARAADPDVPIEVGKQVDTALHSVLLVGAVLIVAILAAVAVIVYRKAFSAAAPAETPNLPPDPLVEAERAQKRGDLAAAAAHFEAAGERLKAAACWENMKDPARAAECYEAAGDLQRAAQLHVRSGGALRAAGIYMQTKNYIEAAKIFRNKGDHLRAAQALELFGNKLAAAREYSAAGSHAHAARLLEGEKMYAEAAEAFRPLLVGEVTPANADRYSTYAALLSLAGDRERAVHTYRSVLAVAPGHLRALSALQSLEPRTPPPPPASPPRVAEAAEAARAADAQVHISPEGAEYDYLVAPAPAPQTLTAPVLTPPPPEDLAREIEIDAPPGQGDPLHRVFTLRSMIQAGRMEPRYSMRLWVQVMRALAERHNANAIFGCLDPESVVIDMENNVRIESHAGCRDEYRAPEVLAGLPPDRQADIYSMGGSCTSWSAARPRTSGRSGPARSTATCRGGWTT
jgi:tetratricopeptide (TPR) repeat protein